MGHNRVSFVGYAQIPTQVSVSNLCCPCGTFPTSLLPPPAQHRSASVCVLYLAWNFKAARQRTKQGVGQSPEMMSGHHHHHGHHRRTIFIFIFMTILVMSFALGYFANKLARPASALHQGCWEEQPNEMKWNFHMIFPSRSDRDNLITQHALPEWLDKG